MLKYSFSLPADFADYEWEVTAKGWFPDVSIIVSGQCYRLNFYDAVRLGQEIESELERGSFFFEPNLVVVKSVTKAEMEKAVELLVRSEQLRFLKPEE